MRLWNRCKGGHGVLSRQLENVQKDFRQMKPRAEVIKLTEKGGNY